MVKWLMVALAVAVAFTAVACVTAQRIDAKYKELAAAYRAENGLPAEAPIPEDVDAKLHAEAERLAAEEAAAERAEAFGKLGGIFGALSTGNIIGAGLGVIGLGALGVKSYGKMRGKP